MPLISPLLAAIDLSQYKFGIFGLALVILMLTRPEGIFPNRQRAVELHGGDADEPIDDQLGEEALDRSPAGRRASLSGIDGRPARRRRASPSASAAWWPSTSVDFTIQERAIVSLIGPNGAGKTTFFNMIAGLYTPTSGEITFQGSDDHRPQAAHDHPARHRADLPEHSPVRAP